VPTTIVSVAADANSLYAALTSDISVDLALPSLPDPTELVIPPNTDLPAVTPLTLADLTTQQIDGTGVFDALMKTFNLHLVEHFNKNRLTASEFGKVYVGGIEVILQQSMAFLLAKDRAQLENLQLIEAVTLSRAQVVKALGEVQLVRAQIQIAYLEAAEMQLKAYTARNQYAASKMELVLGFNGVLDAENKQKLTNANYEIAYAQTHNTLPDGGVVGGVVGTERDMKTVQKQLLGEQYELARAQVRDTLSTGGAFAGLVAIDKLIKQSQMDLAAEQVDTQRAQTKDTVKSGAAVVGILAKEKALKDAQSKLVLEQYESQRGQTRGTLSTGEGVVGLIGAQTDLYKQQITSYKRDAESKAVKMLLDTWTARKTIDEGTPLPVALDTAALQSAVTNYRANLAV
jgi:hypothetical protein